MNTIDNPSSKQGCFDNGSSLSGSSSVETTVVDFVEPTTPYSNTGVLISEHPYSVSVGWITFSCVVADPNDLFAAINGVRAIYCRSLCDEVVESGRPFRGYKNSEITYLGAVLCWTPGRTDFCLTLPQSTCEQVTTQYLLWLVNELLQFGCRVTRLDLTVDDFSRGLNIENLYSECLNGNLVARTDEVDYSAPRKLKTGELREEKLTIGRRSSEFYLRIYDKFLESKGKINAIRVEQELKGKLALGAAKLLIEKAFSAFGATANFDNFSFPAFCDTVLGILAKKIDFRDKHSNNNITRRDRLPFWDKFLHQAAALKVEIKKVVHKIDKVIDWVAESVAASLATLQAYFADDFLDYLKGLLDLGQAKMKRRHFKLLTTNSFT